MTIWSRFHYPTMIVLLSSLAVGCSSVEDQPEDEEEETSLRSLADARGYVVGAGVEADLVRSDVVYRRTLIKQFNALTPGNAMKFGPLRPTRLSFFWDDADLLVEFAEENDMKVRGHTLLWHQQNPFWLTSGNFNRDQLLAIMEEHIKTVVGRYKGRVAAWDVLNEGVDDGGALRKTVWLQGIGPEYIEMAFEWAHEADPDALLFYNDYSAEGSGPKSNGVYTLVTDLKNKGVPIHGVGMQMHFSTEWDPGASAVAANMARLAEAGLLVDITEMDVRIPMPADQQELAVQAELYRSMFDVCLGAVNCSSFIIWGITDAHSWIPGTFPGYGAALLFDENYDPKPAYFRVEDLLMSQN